VSRAADGSPIVYDRVFIPGDRFRITRELHYDLTRPSEDLGDGSPLTVDSDASRRGEEAKPSTGLSTARRHT
jgi:hypothetical protein